MSCCGKKREQFYTSRPSSQIDRNVRPAVRPQGHVGFSSVFFEYVGASGMTVIGPFTGKRYRFERQGTHVEVDLRDRVGLASVPGLRQVALPQTRFLRRA